MPKAPRLSREDWIQAAFRALTRDGAKAIGVQSLARTLGVTKGSFYWHFEDLDELRAQMVAHWRVVATTRVIARLEGLRATPRETLIAMFREVMADPAANYGGHLAEASIRVWALGSEDVARELAQVDSERLAYIIQLLLRGGLDGQTARTRGAFAYAALLGTELMGPSDALSSQDPTSFVDVLLSRATRNFRLT